MYSGKVAENIVVLIADGGEPRAVFEIGGGSDDACHAGFPSALQDGVAIVVELPAGDVAVGVDEHGARAAAIRCQSFSETEREFCFEKEARQHQHRAVTSAALTSVPLALPVPAANPRRSSTRRLSF